MTVRRLFACFDVVHDADLHVAFAKQCETPGSTLSIVDASMPELAHSGWEEKLRGRLSGVDAVVVICGEHTIAAPNVNREFGIAQELDKPYVLLRGRRSAVCTTPVAAKPGDHFYTWMWEILISEIEAAVQKQANPRPDAVEFRGLGRR